MKILQKFSLENERSRLSTPESPGNIKLVIKFHVLEELLKQKKIFERALKMTMTGSNDLNKSPP